MTMNQDWQILLLVTGDRQLAEEWELVLLAQGLSPSLRRTADGLALSVPREEMATALASLSAYERENPRQRAERVEVMETASWLVGATVGLMLLLFYSVTVQWLPALSWFARGSADAQWILQGEVWRTVTALTLHVDVAHVLSNGIAVALFLTAVSSLVGAGLASALILLAGAGGNLANALLHGSSHVSVGASTAVFGAVGLLASLGVKRRRRRALSRWRDWLPAAAALALLGMLGSSGERVDVWAHLLGLLVGAVLGMLVGRVTPRPPSWRFQWACGSAAVAMILGCWIVAIH
jgi:membrane associated rhomboid family serine protease